MRRSLLSLAALVALVLLLVAPAAFAAPAQGDGPQSCSAAAVPQKIKAGDVRPVSFDSPHPLPASWSRTVTSPGAAFLRLHFIEFNLAAGDSITVSNQATGQAWTYTSQGLNGNGDFWSFAIDADTVTVDVNAPSGQSYGFKVIEIGHGTLALNQASISPMVVCGNDGREAIACRTNETVINNTQKSVARLLFTSGGSQYVCTGELIRGSNANTMITNAHCVDTQTEVSTVQAKFNYQYTTCGGSTLGTTTDYAGGTFLKTSSDTYRKQKSGSGLDYTLLTLQGNPEPTWGELIPTTRSYSTGTQINFIQHPGGNPKQIGYWENAEKTVRCKIDTINASYGSAAPSSQAGYGCDSEGGSSGSAITAATDGKVIALHHYGGVASSPCLNSGTMMSKICAHAGSLLQCDSN